MKKYLAILLLFLLQSCQYFEKKIPSEKQLFNQKIKEINWREVDEYPTVDECDKLDDVASRKQCFFDFMSTIIQQKLSVDTLKILFPKIDTIEVKVTLNPDATMSFEPQFPKDSVAYDTIKIDSLLKQKLINFPKINPALKRGIPVKTQFVLPVIIKTEK